jgi:hypothetical protein
MNFKERLLATFQKHNIDAKSVGIALAEEVKLEVEGKLMDGTSVFTSAETFAVGSDVYTKDEAGNNVPAMAGEYVMEDGTTIVVGEDGMVAEIKQQEMETETEMSSEDFFSAIDKLSERISALEADKAALSTELSNEKARVAELSNDLNSTKTELSAMRRTPAAPSVKEKQVALAKTAPVQEKSFSQMTLSERIMSNIQKIKK